VEERRMMEEELALARRALEDERQVRVEELNTARQTLDDVHAQSVVIAAELEQLQKEQDKLRSGLQTAARERDAAIQDHDAAVQECDAAVQECDAMFQGHDAALASAKEASGREKSALASLQSIFLVLFLLSSRLPSSPRC
jgi:chromosome segregation ATPase